MSKSKKSYTPKMRDFYESDPNDLKSYSPSGNTYTIIPDPLVDPVVANNISCPEFDYINQFKTPEK